MCIYTHGFLFWLIVFFLSSPLLRDVCVFFRDFGGAFLHRPVSTHETVSLVFRVNVNRLYCRGHLP